MRLEILKISVGKNSKKNISLFFFSKILRISKKENDLIEHKFPFFQEIHSFLQLLQS
jgi:hypothetical protein